MREKESKKAFSINGKTIRNEMRNEKGVSLITLVITIIVVII